MTITSLLSDKRLFAFPAIVYFSLVVFPGSYVPQRAGLDASWRYAINYLPHSDQVFGRDVAFTYGPIGYFLNPLNVGPNLVIANLFQAFMHLLLIAVLVEYVVRYRRVWPTVFFALGCALAPLVGEGLTDQYEYSYLIIFIVLLVRSYEHEEFSIVYGALGSVLAGMFLFMKFSLGVDAVLMLTALAVIRILQCRRAAWRSAFIMGCVLLSTIFVIVILYFDSLTSLFSWLVISWQMADGYSTAMSFVGKRNVVVWAILGMDVYLVLLVLLRRRRSQLFWVGLVSVIAIFFCFKHSYVRADAHVLFFFPLLLSLIAVLGLNARDSRELGLTVSCYVIAFFLSLPLTFGHHYLGYRTFVDKASGRKGLRNLSSLVHLSETRQGLDGQGQLNLSPDRLPADWQELIGQNGGRVGALPWEINYCAANNFHCDSFPALQTYNAHTAALDQWSSLHYSGTRAPEFLLINFADIDERNLLLSTPATWRVIVQNYSLLKSESAEGVQLFKRTAELAAPPLEVNSRTTARLSDWIPVPTSNKELYAFMDMRLRLRGLAAKTFYRVPPVNISLQYESGKYLSYRMIPATAANGALLNYLPVDMEGLNRLFVHKATDRVTRFRISGPGAKYYKNEFELTWKEGPAIEFDPTQTVNIQALQPVAGPGFVRH